MDNVNWERFVAWERAHGHRPRRSKPRDATKEHHGNLLVPVPPNVIRPSRRLAVPAGALVMIGAFA